jgi:hypothetical protein
VVSFIILALAVPGNAISYPLDGDSFTETTTNGWDIYNDAGDIAVLNSTDYKIGSNSVQLISSAGGPAYGINYDISDVSLSDYDYFVFWLKVNKPSIPWRKTYSIYLDRAGNNHWNLSGNLPMTWTEYRLAKKDMEAGNFDSVSYIHWDWGNDPSNLNNQAPIEVFIDGVHFEKILESYNDSAHNNIDNDFTGNERTVYIYGTVDAAKSYKVVYYDGSDAKRATDLVSTDPLGNLNGNYSFNSSYSIEQGIDQPGKWHVQLFDSSANIPSVYNPSDPDVLAEDSFVVDESVIPEFPAGMVIPFAASLVIFVLMRNRIKDGKK